MTGGLPWVPAVNYRLPSLEDFLRELPVAPLIDFATNPHPDPSGDIGDSNGYPSHWEYATRQGPSTDVSETTVARLDRGVMKSPQGSSTVHLVPRNRGRAARKLSSLTPGNRAAICLEDTRELRTCQYCSKLGRVCQPHPQSDRACAQCHRLKRKCTFASKSQRSSHEYTRSHGDFASGLF